MALLNFLRQKSSTVHTTIGGSSRIVIPTENKDAVSSAVTMGIEQFKNALKGM